MRTSTWHFDVYSVAKDFLGRVKRGNLSPPLLQHFYCWVYSHTVMLVLIFLITLIPCLNLIKFPPPPLIHIEPCPIFINLLKILSNSYHQWCTNQINFQQNTNISFPCFHLSLSRHSLSKDFIQYQNLSYGESKSFWKHFCRIPYHFQLLVIFLWMKTKYVLPIQNCAVFYT